MGQACVFCAIVQGTEPAGIVYEDAHTLAFMNLRQANPGHTLVIPKAHVVTLDTLPEATARPLMQAVVTVTRAVQLGFGPPGINVWQSNGEVAGQEIPHVHFQVVPRWPDDAFETGYTRPQSEQPIEERRRLAAKLREYIT